MVSTHTVQATAAAVALSPPKLPLIEAQLLGFLIAVNNEDGSHAAFPGQKANPGQIASNRSSACA